MPGNAIGAALLAYYEMSSSTRVPHVNDSMRGAYLGPSYSNEFIKDYLNKINAKYNSIEDDELFEQLTYLEGGKVIGWFNGPMEFGPRALGARSIIGDPRNTNMQKTMNLKNQI